MIGLPYSFSAERLKENSGDDDIHYGASLATNYWVAGMLLENPNYDALSSDDTPEKKAFVSFSGLLYGFLDKDKYEEFMESAITNRVEHLNKHSLDSKQVGS